MRPWLKIVFLVLLAGLGALWLAPAPAPSGSVAPGARAPDVRLRDLSGREVTLASLRGRAVVVNFWATWCHPCREEMPALSAAWRASRGRCVETLGVAEESAREDVESEVRRMEIAFPVLLDPEGATARAFGVAGFPQTYLVDAEGVVRRVFAGAVTRERLESALQPLVPATCPGGG